ncbi:glyoxalase [Sulfitobacter sp. SK012]|uniref:VOC family protein n=1 Tax=Sulfitobacter sp. SK012 TaxID=1389005 RepID=UPI000E0BE786|nr:VOC family protein [Sulfitobacter sp. SK012]AXI47983.1 glyoxalase [Sulfitobacter sp. SK012]
MQITKLDHVNLRTTQLDKMVTWYTDILGLRIGERPDFPFPGAWLFAGDQAVVHLMDVEEDAGTGSEVPLKLEHFAFRAEGATGFEDRLNASGEKYRRSDQPKMKLVAFNVWDPDGNHIHVDFET